MLNFNPVSVAGLELSNEDSGRDCRYDTALRVDSSSLDDAFLFLEDKVNYISCLQFSCLDHVVWTRWSYTLYRNQGQSATMNTGAIGV
jgi:hypothetical protein